MSTSIKHRPNFRSSVPLTVTLRLFCFCALSLVLNAAFNFVATLTFVKENTILYAINVGMLSYVTFLSPTPFSIGQPCRASPIHRREVIKMVSTHPQSQKHSVAFVLSHLEAHQFLSLRKSASENATYVSHGSFSVDLGKRTLSSVIVHAEGISLNDDNLGSRVLATWHQLKKMSKKGKSGAYEVFLDGKSQPQKIAGLSDETNMPASLFPTSPYKPPTLVLGGYGMHRIKDTDPAADTASKIAAIGPTHLRGRVLDICTGLGYTAIEASRASSVSSVITMELDPFVVDVQRRNPWSQDLFCNPKIHRIVGNAIEAVRGFPDSRFDTVIHDPPAQVLGGDLYGIAFYEELSRVCVKGGKLYHYIGDPSSVESGRLFRGVMERLEKAGFSNITKHSNAYGLTAIRGLHTKR